MHFHVDIFLNNGSLKWEFRKFSSHPNTSRRPHLSNPSSSEDDSGEILPSSESRDVEEIEDSQKDSEDNVDISESSAYGESVELEYSSNSSKPIVVSSNTTSEDSKQDSEDNTFDDGDEESNVAGKPLKSKFPHFTCVIKRTYNQLIPRAFHCHFPTRQFDLILKDVETGTKGKVGVICGNGRYCISAGFSAFLTSSRIRPGDTCMFEILNKKKMLVSVLKKG